MHTSSAQFLPDILRVSSRPLSAKTDQIRRVYLAFVSAGRNRLREAAHVSICLPICYRGRSGAFSDELQPTESFRNVSDPQYEFGTLGGDDMGKAFA